MIRFKVEHRPIRMSIVKAAVVGEGAYERGYAKGYEDGVDQGKTIEDDFVAGSLDGAYINNRVTTIGAYAFYGTDITALNLPNVTSAENYFCQQCERLTDVSLPLLKAVSAYAFYRCTALKRLEFPTATSILAAAFYGCTVLDTVVLRSETVCTLVHTNAFLYTPIANGTGFIYVPDNLVEQYKTAAVWLTYAAQIKPISELI